jgi:hypothetical protein
MHDEGQAAQLERVGARIGHWVHEWCRLRSPPPQGDGRTFTADQLLAYVQVQLSLDGERATIRPDSPDRTMRDLRQRGVIDVENTSRLAGTYRVLAVRPFGYRRPVERVKAAQMSFVSLGKRGM